MGAMKRFALFLAALCVIGSSALAVSTVHAYQPVDAEVLTVSPQQGPSGFEFTATLANCFPGELVTLAIASSSWSPPDEPPAPQVPPAGADVLVSVTELCPTFGVLQVSHVFEAPTEYAIYPVIAFMAAEDDSNPDIPDRPDRLLVDYITVCEACVPIGGQAGIVGDGEVDGGAVVVTTGGSDDNWPNFLSSAGFYRVFLALLGLMAGIFFVWLWRRRREDERVGATYGAGAMPPPDPSNPSMA